MYLSESRKEAREKFLAKVKNFEKNNSPSADDLADYKEAKIELEKYMTILWTVLFYGLKHSGMKKAKKHLSIFLTLEKQES